jgi:UPF0755 protein
MQHGAMQHGAMQHGAMQHGGDEMLDDLDLAWEEQETRRRRGQPASRQQRQRRKKEKKRQRRSFGALFISLLLLVALGGGVYWGVGWIQETFGVTDYEANPAKVEVEVVVKPGDGAAAIAEELFNKKVVASAKAFVKAAEADPKSVNIQPGTYKLYQEMPARIALAYLLEPAKYMVVDQVTIREGLTAIQTFKKLSAATGIPETKFKEAAKDPMALGVQDWWFKRNDGKKSAGTIEGFLFPDTYRFAPKSSAEEILKAMVNRFNTVVGELKFADRVQRDRGGISPYEALIVASLAQVEAGNQEDLGKVARVAYNRLYTDFACKCLQFDVTANYWLELSGKPTKSSAKLLESELHDPKNPYNTHDVEGLPVGPISNPGKSALEGAVNPPAGKWFYFVAIDKEGHSAFAETLSQHRINEALACKNGVLTC